MVVGGGNSAGQAAVYLAGKCRHIHLLVRSKGLAATMSNYLIRRIQETGNIQRLNQHRKWRQRAHHRDGRSRHPRLLHDLPRLGGRRVLPGAPDLPLPTVPGS